MHKGSLRGRCWKEGTGRTEPFRWPWEPKPKTPSLPDIEDNAAGPITISIESNDEKTVYASGTINLEKSIFWNLMSNTLN